MSISRGMEKEDMVHTYTGTLLSHRRNKVVSFAEMWMDLETVIQSEVSQKNKYCISIHIYGI